MSIEAREFLNEVELAWQQEIARRLNELDEGNVKTIPWNEVRQRLAAKLPYAE